MHGNRPCGKDVSVRLVEHNYASSAFTAKKRLIISKKDDKDCNDAAQPL
jgi:hypothetical protein